MQKFIQLIQDKNEVIKMCKNIRKIYNEIVKQIVFAKKIKSDITQN